MNEKPSFYPKHLARQYVSSSRCESRPKAEIRPMEAPNTESKIAAKKFMFAPTITSSTVHLQPRPSVPQEHNAPAATLIPEQQFQSRQNLVPKMEPTRPASKVLNGLPDSFVEAMRRLFNLMDINNEGRIKFDDIATQWSNGDSDRHLPTGVVASLSKVATQDGFLTFERFCAGIKISILRQEAAEKKRKAEEQNKNKSNDNSHLDSCGNSTNSSNSSAEFSSTSGYTGSERTPAALSPPTSFTSQNENASNFTAALPNGNVKRVQEQAELNHQRNLSEMRFMQQNENMHIQRAMLPTVNVPRFPENNENADKYRTSPVFNPSTLESQNAAENAQSGTIAENDNFQRPMSPATFAERFGKENRQPPVAMYQSPVSPIRSSKRYESLQYGNHFVNSPLSRTSSLPILPGALRAVHIPGQQDDENFEVADDGDVASRFTAPSPVPSEPWGGKAFKQEEEERRRLIEGPPKPPRDPSRMSGVFMRGSTHSLPASSHQPITYPNISSYIQVDRTEAPIQFIWKSPPPEMRMPSIANYQNFSIIVDENTKRNKPANNEIIVLRKPGSFRSGQVNGGGGGVNGRRHTLQNGVDVTMMRRIKTWEEEKSVLEEGLQTLQRAQASYRHRLGQVENNLQFCPTDSGHTDASQERLILELNAIRELNQRLCHFANAGGLNLNPIQHNSEARTHDLLAEDNRPVSPCSGRRILRLQEQNRMLTEEVGRKSQLITALEQDKRSLIRQLFTQTASHGGSTDTIKSGTSFRQNSVQPQPSLTSQSNIHQPTKSSYYSTSMNKTGHLDIKKLC